jgi:hypothetical protein
MSTVNYHVLNDSVILNYDAKTQVIASTDSRYAQVIQAIKEKRLEDIPAIVEIERHFEGSGLTLRDGVLYDGDSAIPPQLNKRILAFKEEGLPFEPLIAFWNNLKKNPSFNSRQMLFAFLEHNGHPLTQDGKFIAYRGISGDFKDKHTGTMDNSPGTVVQMPRDLVDDNPNNTCSNGLHVACFDYARGFGEKLVEVKVDPADVVAVPTDYNGTKMRVARFEVIQEVASMRTEQLYGHQSEADYADEDTSDEEELSEEDRKREALEKGECPECSHDIDNFSNFCSECGADLDDYR